MISPYFSRRLQITASGQMGQPGGFGEAVTATTFQYTVNGSIQVNLMPDGDINRLDVTSGSQHGTNDLTAIHHYSMATGRISRGTVAAAQPGFGTADGRRIQQQPQVRSKAQATGVGNPLTINDYYIRGQ